MSGSAIVVQKTNMKAINNTVHKFFNLNKLLPTLLPIVIKLFSAPIKNKTCPKTKSRLPIVKAINKSLLKEITPQNIKILVSKYIHTTGIAHCFSFAR